MDQQEGPLFRHAEGMVRLTCRHLRPCSGVEHALKGSVLWLPYSCTLAAADAAVNAQAEQVASVRASDAMLNHGSRLRTAAPMARPAATWPPCYMKRQVRVLCCIIQAVGHEGCVAPHIAALRQPAVRKRSAKLICMFEGVPVIRYTGIAQRRNVRH